MVSEKYEHLYEAYAARARRHVAALQELAALRAEVDRLRSIVEFFRMGVPRNTRRSLFPSPRVGSRRKGADRD